MSVAERAYLAGLLDGEGHISLDGRRLQITNTDYAMMLWCLKATGVGVIQESPRTAPRKTCYVWRTGSSAARIVLEQVEKYLVIKRERARQAIEALAHARPKAEAQEAFKLEIVQCRGT